MEEGSSFDVKPDLKHFFHFKEEKPDIKVLDFKEEHSSLKTETVQDIHCFQSDEIWDVKNIFLGIKAEPCPNLLDDRGGFKGESHQTDLNTLEDEKPCIATLRASVEEYSAKQTLEGKDSTPREQLSDGIETGLLESVTTDRTLSSSSQ
ncbi:hypothetical protein EGW08_002058, partial [Elysia chlorotica]